MVLGASAADQQHTIVDLLSLPLPVTVKTAKSRGYELGIKIVPNSNFIVPTLHFTVFTPSDICKSGSHGCAKPGLNMQRSTGGLIVNQSAMASLPMYETGERAAFTKLAGDS